MSLTYVHTDPVYAVQSNSRQTDYVCEALMVSFIPNEVLSIRSNFQFASQEKLVCIIELQSLLRKVHCCRTLFSQSLSTCRLNGLILISVIQCTMVSVMRSSVLAYS